MVKNSTLSFSIHGLASQAYPKFTKNDTFPFRDEFFDVFEKLNKTRLNDVKQETVDNIMQFAYDYK